MLNRNANMDESLSEKDADQPTGRNDTAGRPVRGNVTIRIKRTPENRTPVFFIRFSLLAVLYSSVACASTFLSGAAALEHSAGTSAAAFIFSSTASGTASLAADSEIFTSFSAVG